jgi:ParB family chromosome partitioning protein
VTTTSIPVAKLVHSPRNGRQPDAFAPDSPYHATADIEAQILEFGLIHPPTAHPMPRGKYGVFIGGRRLLALQRLIARGDLSKDHAIDVTIRDEADLVLSEMSFAENETRVALPAVTEYETYARLIEDGANLAAVAQRYQVSELHVKQRMRLGQLHPDIRAALAAERLSLDFAKAYATTADQDLQKRIFDTRPAHLHEIRVAMKRDLVAAGADRMIALVGMDAYVAAGGRAEEDFFEIEAPRILDLDILQRLYAERLDEERTRLGLLLRVTMQFGFDGVGARIEDIAHLTDEQHARLFAIDSRLEDIECRLDEIAEYDGDGPIGRWKAIDSNEQAEVDQLVAERTALETESEALQGSSIETITGPIIAVVDIVDRQLKLRGYFRPAGWTEDTISTSVTAGGHAAAGAAIDQDAVAVPAANRPAPTTTGAMAADARPVINGFRSDRQSYSGVYRQPEEVAREEHGLTKDGVEAMRSHYRLLLGAALLNGPHEERLAHRYLIFVLARGMLRAAEAGAVRREGAAELGVDRLPGHDHDPAQVRPDLAVQPGGVSQREAIERLRMQDWMREVDPAIALRRFATAPHIEVERAAACVAVMMLSRSLAVPGFVVGPHQVLGELLNIDGHARDHWTPDAAYFARLPKSRKLEAIRFVDEAVARRVANLSTDDLTTAAAAIMSGDRAAAEKYGLTREAAARAAGWMPPYLSFTEAETPDDDPDGADAIDVEQVAA